MKAQAAAATTAAVVLILLVGVWLWFVSLRPCRIALKPGQLVSYRLTSEWSPIGADDIPGEPTLATQDIDLICIGGDNEVALVNPGVGEARDEITLLDFAANGSARRFDPTSQVHDDGKALGFFDFNLLPLPPGSEQSWNVSLIYAALPPDRRQVQGKVRRLTNGSSPTFRLTLPPIDWINQDRRWQQIKGLKCEYRFNTAKGVVESATIVCQAGIERPDGYLRFHVRTDLTLLGMTAGKDDALALRDLALATAEAQDALAARRVERLEGALGRLANNPATHERLRALAGTLRGEVGVAGGRQRVAHAVGQGVAKAQPQPQQQPAGRAAGWAVQVGSAPLKSRASVDRLAKELVADGFPAYVVAKKKSALALVGPYESQDAAVLGEMRKRFAKAKPYWVKVD